MNRTVFSIVLLAVLAHSSTARTVKNTLGRRDFDRLYRAVVDISTTCYGDPGKAIGIIGDTDGSILKALRLNHFIPVVLVNGSRASYLDWVSERAYKLQVFIVAVHSPSHLLNSIFALKNYIWWNDRANFLIVDTRPEPSKQCSSAATFMYVTNGLAMLNAQFICYDLAKHKEAIIIYTSNPFVPRAPKVWMFVYQYTFQSRIRTTTGFLFVRMYREGGRSCRSINFAKTGNVGGAPLHFVTRLRLSVFRRRHTDISKQNRAYWLPSEKVTRAFINEHRWFIDNIVNALNASEVLTNKIPTGVPTIILELIPFSSCSQHKESTLDRMIVRHDQFAIYAVTQHTGHMTQLDKILSVTDENSRIGIYLVYLITFLFFKFILHQTVMPALLNLVRLTCNTGLTTMPQNLAPRLYLTGIFIFVVTFQGIYTGNLAMLLTTTIPYKNVQVKEDIPKLGYTVYLTEGNLAKLAADPVLDGRIVEIPEKEDCLDYVLRDSLAVCVADHVHAVASAIKYKLHVSSFPIMHDYGIYVTMQPNILRHRIQEILVISFEAGLSYSDAQFERLRLQYIDDDEVKKNTDRRVMTFLDLRFAFVILGVGLLCSFGCFVGEIVIWRIGLEYAKRRNRVRVRSAWGVTAERCSWFRSLNCRFNFRRLFSNRR